MKTIESQSWRSAAAIAVTLLILTGSADAFAKGQAKRTLEGQVNLNTATAEQLQMLPGIGAATAERIVEARKEKPFEFTWEVVRVKGIGAKLYRKLEDRLLVSGASTIRWVEPAPSPKRSRHGRRKGPKILTFSPPAAERP